MWDLCKLIWWAFIGLFRLRVALVAENLALRKQINVLRRTAPKRPRFGSIDRLIFVGLFRGCQPLATHVQPATVILLWVGVTAHPTGEWIAHQLTEACGWDQAPIYLLRDRDQVYGQAFTRRMRAMGIRDRPTSPRSPRQNAFAERPIGSIRRECVDHIVVFGEQHLRHALLSRMNYYNEVRTHLMLGKDAPVSRLVHAVGRILPRPILGGLHHEYVRI